MQNILQLGTTSGSLKNSKNQLLKTSQKPTSVFAPLTSRSSDKSAPQSKRAPNSRERKDLTCLGGPKDEVNGAFKREPTTAERSNEGIKTSLSMNYVAKPRGKKRGRRASCFKAQTNMQKKDISDSNIYNGSDDGENEVEVNEKAGRV